MKYYTRPSPGRALRMVFSQHRASLNLAFFRQNEESPFRRDRHGLSELTRDPRGANRINRRYGSSFMALFIS